MKIALSTDHAGYGRLPALRKFLESLGHECVSFGPRSADSTDDYPDFIVPAAEAVANGECERGIVMGGSGQGEAMAANRVKGIRCTVYYGPAKAKYAIDSQGNKSGDPLEILHLSREHNDANMLSFGVRFLSDHDMQNAAQLWLNLNFSSEERHVRRIRKLDEV